MSIYCCICGSRISENDECFELNLNYKNEYVCSDCADHLKELKSFAKSGNSLYKASRRDLSQLLNRGMSTENGMLYCERFIEKANAIFDKALSNRNDMPTESASIVGSRSENPETRSVSESNSAPISTSHLDETKPKPRPTTVRTIVQSEAVSKSENLICKNCGAENLPDSMFCEHCAAQLRPQWFCRYCGKPVSSVSKMCDSCKREYNRSVRDNRFFTQSNLENALSADKNKVDCAEYDSRSFFADSERSGIRYSKPNFINKNKYVILTVGAVIGITTIILFIWGFLSKDPHNNSASSREISNTVTMPEQADHSATTTAPEFEKIVCASPEGTVLTYNGMTYFINESATLCSINEETTQVQQLCSISLGTHEGIDKERIWLSNLGYIYFNENKMSSSVGIGIKINALTGEKEQISVKSFSGDDIAITILGIGGEWLYFTKHNEEDYEVYRFNLNNTGEEPEYMSSISDEFGNERYVDFYWLSFFDVKENEIIACYSPRRGIESKIVIFDSNGEKQTEYFISSSAGSSSGPSPIGANADYIFFGASRLSRTTGESQAFEVDFSDLGYSDKCYDAYEDRVYLNFFDAQTLIFFPGNDLSQYSELPSLTERKLICSSGDFVYFTWDGLAYARVSKLTGEITSLQ